jgi:UDP-glucose 4-epimerase
MCEKIIADHCNANTSFRCAILRYFNPAGASTKYDLGEDTPNPQNIVPKLLDKIRRNEPFTVYGTNYDGNGDGTAIRDYIHIDDLVNAHLMIIQKFNELPQCCIMNVGSGKGTSVATLIKTMSTINNIDIETINCDRRPGDVAVLIANTDRIQKLINFKCEHSIESICTSAYTYTHHHTPHTPSNECECTQNCK